ncbi:hypothetical protein PIROE2DRAFT_1586 [Piromyces sp. E2]|nr:hypothetical protein PIROE2DRAFT_1586 [Piromyces sp. E2]|eukprot:OUM70188.1 hypothetical protein PIROE2DRAFT_1586 [Piromyces sp. E2]
MYSYSYSISIKLTCFYTYLGIPFHENLSFETYPVTTSRVQSLINTGILWRLFHERNFVYQFICAIKRSKNSSLPWQEFVLHNKLNALSNINGEKSNYIIRDLTHDIPTLFHYSWTK